MIELNDASVTQFTYDMHRGTTLLKFEGFDEQANHNIGMLIRNIILSANTYKVQVDHHVNDRGHNGLNGLEPVNRLIVLLLNYFWHHGNDDLNSNNVILQAISENEDLIEYIKEHSPVLGNEQHNSNSAIDTRYHRMKKTITEISQFFRNQDSLIAPELLTFLNEYTQSFTNPFQPNAVEHFSIFDSSLKLNTAEERRKTFSFTPSERKITVTNICSGITVNIVHDELNNVEMKLPKQALSFSSHLTFRFGDSENFTFQTKYDHSGDLLELFENCQQSEKNTAAFLAVSLRLYCNKEKYGEITPDDVNQQIQNIINDLIKAAGEKFKTANIVLKQLKDDKQSTISCRPYLAGPMIGVVFGGGLIAVATIIGTPVLGALVFGAEVVGGLLGAGAAIGANKCQEHRNNRHKTEITAIDVSNIISYGSFPRSSSINHVENNIIIPDNCFNPSN